MSFEQCVNLGQRYIDETMAHRNGTPFFIDKMPNNFRHIPFIQLILSNRVLRVQHEDLHENLEQQVRRILDYCELPFEQNCVEFHQSTRPVRTPSSEQVRLPLYKDAVHQWEHYEGFLEPLKQALSGE